MTTEESQQSSTNNTEIAILHDRLATQSRNLLAEIDAFSTHITSSRLVQHPETLINKFRTEIIREAKLLDHHSSVLGLSPAASPPTEPSRQDQRPSQTLRKSINRVERLELSSDESRHRLRSSNIPHLSSLWQTAKQQSGIRAIRKQVRFPSIHHSSDCPTPDVPHVSCRRNRAARGRVKLEDGGTYQPVGKTTKHGTKNREPVNVDLVCEHGTVWIKLFTKSLDWMAMDLAREGIVDLATEEVEHCSSNEEERTNGHLCQPSKDVGHGSKQKQKFSEEVVAAVEELKLVKMATEFLLAAKTARVDHWHPEVHFYLTRIERGASQDIDLVLEHIESKGISVKAANELSLRGSTNNLNGSTEDNSGTLDLTSTFAKMICPSPSPPPPTTTLNIDCTLLIALTSDISHLSPTSTAIPVHYTDRPSLKDIEQQFSSETTDHLVSQDFLARSLLSESVARCLSISIALLEKTICIKEVVDLVQEVSSPMQMMIVNNNPWHKPFGRWKKFSSEGTKQHLSEYLPSSHVSFLSTSANRSLIRRSPSCSIRFSYECIAAGREQGLLR